MRCFHRSVECLLCCLIVWGVSCGIGGTNRNNSSQQDNISVELPSFKQDRLLRTHAIKFSKVGETQQWDGAQIKLLAADLTSKTATFVWSVDSLPVEIYTGSLGGPMKNQATGKEVMINLDRIDKDFVVLRVYWEDVFSYTTSCPEENKHRSE
jgi:hypothetical protein